jgi:hypothetical protein
MADHTVTAQEPEVENASNIPSPDSKDGIKEKEDAIYHEVPSYTDIEDLKEEIHLETAADIVTQVIHLDDDPSINPWTFRMFFLGMAVLPDDSNPPLSSNFT